MDHLLLYPTISYQLIVLGTKSVWIPLDNCLYWHGGFLLI